MINKTILVGRMTRNPELRRTNSGAAVTSFTLALNRNYDSADGQKADFIPCVVWNKTAENVEKYCSQGSLVGVEGRMRSRTYDDKDGQKVFVVEVVCESVQFLETKASREKAQQDQPKQYPQTQQTSSFYEVKEADNSTFDIVEDDIQF